MGEEPLTGGGKHLGVATGSTISSLFGTVHKRFLAGPDEKRGTLNFLTWGLGRKKYKFSRN